MDDWEDPMLRHIDRLYDKIADLEEENAAMRAYIAELEREIRLFEGRE